MLKDYKPTPLGIIMAGLALGTAIVGCRSSVAPSHVDTAILAQIPNYQSAFAEADDNEAKLRIACAAAKDATLTQHARAAWLKIWKDLAFAEAKVSLELLKALATNPLATDVDANLFRAFVELAPATIPSK